VPFTRGGRLLVFGNGNGNGNGTGTGTDLQHVTVEFAHPLIVGKPGAARAVPG